MVRWIDAANIDRKFALNLPIDRVDRSIESVGPLKEKIEYESMISI
jgi:hypothetical protein